MIEKGNCEITDQYFEERKVIPKILHQCSKSFEWEERQFANSAKKLLPDYEYRAWDDSSNLEFIKQTIPQYFEAYNQLPHNVARVDVARCLYLFIYGGIYFDTDYVFYKRPNEEFLRNRCVLAIEEEDCKSIGGGDKVGNAFLASEPGFEMWIKFVDYIFQRFYAGEKRVVYLSGPHALSIFLKENPQYNNGITVLPRHAIYPDFSMGKLTTIKKQDTLGAHLCWGSWRGKPFKQRLKSKTRRLLSAIVGPMRVNYSLTDT
jgi:mannosyltransferase OCH1-like enzyme